MGTMTESARLSRSMDNLALDELEQTLAEQETVSKSMDNLNDSLPSSDKNSLDLKTYFDDNEEGTDEERMELCKSQNSITDNPDPKPGMKFLEQIDESGLGHSESPPLKARNHQQRNFDVSHAETKTSKHEITVSKMLVLEDKEKSVLDKNWEQLKIDKDIQAAVNEFMNGFFESYLSEARNDEKILLLKALHEDMLKPEIYRWLSAKLQIERDGWSYKFKMALKEADDYRKSALRAVSLSQDCSEQLRLLLDCFNISDPVLNSIPVSKSKEAIQRSLELLVEICNALMEDRFQCMQLMKMEDTGGMLAEFLQLHFQKQDKAHQLQVQEAVEQVRQAESENLKLLKEVMRMKKVLGQKQQDLDFLQKQVADINDLVTTKQVKTCDKTTDTSTDGFNSTSKQGNPKRPLTETSISSKASVSTKKSSRSSTDTKLNTKEGSGIHISQEKLHSLKQRARKLEDSLHEAIASMDKLRKSTGPVTNNNNADIQSDTDLSPLSFSHSNELGDLSELYANRVLQKPAFEVKGAPRTPQTSKIQVNGSIPKLNLKHVSKISERRSFSERVPTKEVFQQMEIKKTAELSATLAQLKSFKPQAGKVSKCLRCQKLFRSIDNHKLACLYHPKIKERVEKYTGGGQLLKVFYMWTCCRQEVDSEGCCYGQHV